MPLDKHIQSLLTENNRRQQAIHAKFNPITGEGSPCPRTRVEIADFPLPTQFLPNTMLAIPLVAKIIKAGSLKAFFNKQFPTLTYSDAERAKIINQFIRIRIRHDFPFWAASYIYVKNKEPGGKPKILFRLNRPQRRFIERLEQQRTADKPIRFVMLKARQWGGSTASQIYMMWMQLVHHPGLNSLIIAQTKKTSYAIRAMFDRALRNYPTSLLHDIGTAYANKEPVLINMDQAGDYKAIPQRDCTISIGSYEAPDNIRGDNYALVHCSEVGVWEPTPKKSPDDVVRSFSGVPLLPYTMIIYESTAKGYGNFFHREYVAAKTGKSQFLTHFVPWYEIDLYSLPFKSEREKAAFANRLYANRLSDDVASDREEPGKYLWSLWERGATLEAVNWYVQERAGKSAHSIMASEYPSDDVEAFTFSGNLVFNSEDIDQFRPSCRPPKIIGDISGKDTTGSDALLDLQIRPEPNGHLSVWQDVEHDTDTEYVSDRYLVVVDVCKGHTERADYSVIAVFDRLYMIDGEPPAIVAQWYGHIDMDMLAWKSAQIAQYYNEALLVIESNTLETNNTKGEAEYILTLVREVYPNLYARKQSAEDIRQGRPRKYGFHTNTLTKPPMIQNLKTVLRERLYTERDEGCLNEYATYSQTEKGSFEALEGYHDDRLMTRAIGLHICFHEMPLPRIVTVSKTTFSPRIISEATI